MPKPRIARSAPTRGRSWFSLSSAPPARRGIDQMDILAMLAGLGGAVVAGLAFFFVGRSAGRGGELQRQQAAKATAEEVSKRIVADAERDAENLKKSALVS